MSLAHTLGMYRASVGAFKRVRSENEAQASADAEAERETRARALRDVRVAKKRLRFKLGGDILKSEVYGYMNVEDIKDQAEWKQLQEAEEWEHQHASALQTPLEVDMEVRGRAKIRAQEAASARAAASSAVAAAVDSEAHARGVAAYFEKEPSLSGSEGHEEEASLSGSEGGEEGDDAGGNAMLKTREVATALLAKSTVAWMNPAQLARMSYVPEAQALGSASSEVPEDLASRALRLYLRNSKARRERLLQRRVSTATREAEEFVSKRENTDREDVADADRRAERTDTELKRLRKAQSDEVHRYTPEYRHALNIALSSLTPVKIPPRKIWKSTGIGFERDLVDNPDYLPAVKQWQEIEETAFAELKAEEDRNDAASGVKPNASLENHLKALRAKDRAYISINEHSVVTRLLKSLGRDLSDRDLVMAADGLAVYMLYRAGERIAFERSVRIVKEHQLKARRRLQTVSAREEDERERDAAVIKNLDERARRVRLYGYGVTRK